MDTRRPQKALISILMESPLYLTLPLRERQALLVRMAESYPFLADMEDDEPEVGYESSWKGIF